MLSVAQVVAVILVSIAMGPALAHALELPGKMRLTREAYLAVQTIYYPGFTIAGIAEPLSLIAAIFLLFLTPARSADFWLTLLALVGLIGMQAVYWFVTHPVNRRWIQGEQLSGLGAGFFSFASADRSSRHSETRPPGWTELRDRWEYSHLVRALFALLSLVALVISMA